MSISSDSPRKGSLSSPWWQLLVSVRLGPAAQGLVSAIASAFES